MTYTAKRPRAVAAQQERQPHDAGDTADSGDGGLASYLEPDQLMADTVPRAQLSTRAAAGLWALRIFVIAVGAMVVYTFFSQLG
jgi:hypothetical protein